MTAWGWASLARTDFERPSGWLMICAILGRGRHAALAEEWKEAAEAGVQLVELRVDCLRREPDLKRVLRERPTPMVFTVPEGPTAGSGGPPRRSASG